MAMGIMTLLMAASMAGNELIIRTLRSVRSIEASNRAYFAAEGGVEDALYELSPHLAGYQTPKLNTDNARRNVFDDKGNLAKCSDVGNANRWANCWTIESRNGSSAWSEKMLKGQKLDLSLYDDKSGSNVPYNAIGTDAAVSENLALAMANFSIKFSIPDPENPVTGISTIMNHSGTMMIDNDQDGKINKDPAGTVSKLCPNGSANPNPADDDCDGKVDEDSDADPVILWKLTDNNGRSLIPIKGCLGDLNSKPTPADGNEKSELCERDFRYDNNWSDTLDSNTYGENENGVHQTIGDFISKSTSFPDDRMQFEFLIVAPMEFVNPNTNPLQKVAIPYIKYDVSSDSTEIPYPYFKLESDGYYGSYKQSITTTLLPKTTVPLFDFTIIQQQ